MTEAHVFIATSLDGYIARPDGGIDWLDTLDFSGEDHGYDAFMAQIDALVMGRKTYETVLGFGGDWPYSKPVWVLSSTIGPDDVPDALRNRVRILSGSPQDILAEAERAGFRRVYVDGGEVIQAFLAEGLIDEIVLSRLPILIGAGRPLFGALAADRMFSHVETRAFPSGLVQSRYRRT